VSDLLSQENSEKREILIFNKTKHKKLEEKKKKKGVRFCAIFNFLKLFMVLI